MTALNALVQGLFLGGLFALFACGLSLMFGVMEVINLAHGDIAVAAVYLGLSVIAVTHIPAIWVFVAVVPVFMVGGYLGQRFFLQRSLDSGPVTTLLVTFGLSIVLENVLQQVYSANSQSLNIGSLVSDSVQISSQISLPYLSMIFLATSIVALAVVHLFLRRTKTGRMVRAVADDREAAQLVGADYRHLFGVAAAIATGSVALAGLALGMYTSISPSAGPSYLLYGFAAVVIGGMGSLWGTLAGGMVLGLATTVGSLVNPDFGAMLPYLVFLAVLAVRPRGLFPKKALL